MTRRLLLIVALAGALLQPGCQRAAPGEVRVVAASSLVELVSQTVPLAERRGLQPVLQLEASSEARAQIEHGLPADVFITADPRDVDRLESAGQVEPGTRRELFRNRLVLVAPRNNPKGLRGIRDLERVPARVGIGHPSAVPAGRYARQALEKMGLWERLQGSLVHGKDVRVVLGWVAQGEVDAGIVYATDAKEVLLVEAFPEGTHDPIVYDAVIPRHPPHPRDARAYLDLLSSPEAVDAARRLGFQPAARSGK